MAKGSTVAVVSGPKAILHKTFWLIVVAVAIVLIATVLLLPNQPNVFGGYSTRQLAYLLAVFYIAGLESGLSGFGFSGVAAAALALLPPILGTPLLQSLSTANQLVSIGELKQDMPKTFTQFWQGPGPYILGGLAGTPIGVWLLTHLPAAQLMLIFGSILLLYSLYSLFRPATFKINGGGSSIAGVIVGFLGGTLGGFTAFPGAAVVVWSSLRNIPKEKNRAIVQPYIVVGQIYSLSLLAWLHPNVFSHQYWILLAILVPAVLPGTATGVAIYKRISDINFKRITYFCLGLSGAVLLLKVLMK
jgi:uncharacterized membrane protein YfcA